jgi:diguanylate cyclase (GGDEF)-like protein/PAS domain S-box-containing protein
VTPPESPDPREPVTPVDADALRAALAEHASDVILVGDADGKIVYASPSVTEAFGYEPDELIGLDGFDLVHPDDIDDVVAAFTEQAKNPRVPARVHVKARHADRSWRDCETVFTNCLADPRIRGLVVTVRDISDRKRAEQALRESETRFRSLVQHASDIVTVFDVEGIISYISPSVRVMGFEPSELLGTQVALLLHPDDALEVGELITRQIMSGGTPTPIDYRVRHADGTWRYLQGVATNLLDEPTVNGIVVNARDITDRKRTEQLLEGQSTVLEMVARGEPLEATLEAIARMVEEHASTARCAIVVYGADDRSPRFAVAPSLPAGWAEPGALADLGVGRSALAANRRDDGEAGGTLGWSSPIVASGGERVLGALALVPDERRFPSAEEQRVAGVSANLAVIALERSEAAERLSYQARHDPLTGLANRSLFLHQLEALLRTPNRTGQVGVLFLDLDHFKDINDGLGHQVGDRVLVALARRLEGALRAGDTLARFGGDEFVILCTVEGPQHAKLVAERLLQRIRRPYSMEGDEVVLSASVGIAVADRLDRDVMRPELDETLVRESADALLRDADVAMYRAKERGRARVELFDHALRTGLLARLETEAALRHALDRKELELQYQPVVALSDRRIIGVEALLRWWRPGHGIMLPADFIPGAEQSGFVVPVGEWVVGEACRQAAAWNTGNGSSRPVAVAINLSGRQLMQPRLVATVQRELEQAGAAPRSLCLEITESVFLDDLASTLVVLDELHELGVHLLLDDFGTGYSSFEYLRRLPVDGLKLDRSFVSGLGTSRVDSSIVGAVVGMAHALDLVVVAEGVEHENQLEELLALGCDYGQGFLFASPQPAEALEPAVREAVRRREAGGAA